MNLQTSDTIAYMRQFMTLLLIEQILIYTSLLVSMVCFVIGLKQKGCEEQKISLASLTLRATFFSA